MVKVREALVAVFSGAVLAAAPWASMALAQGANIGKPDRDDIEYPDDEPPSAEEVELGKKLFYDRRLSAKKNISCATCHNPNLGFGDGFALGLGQADNVLGRNTPHIYNLAWNTVFFWDGRASSLEEQALGPIEAKAEMDLKIDEAVSRIAKVKEYQQAFKKIYKSKVTKENMAKAIAAFERTIIVDDTPFDRYISGDQNAMIPAAVRGMQLFLGKGRCVVCHSGPNFTDESFHNIGLENQKDEGRNAVVKGKNMTSAFKTPGLRNVLLTAPYMHDGSLGTLEEVMRHYNTGGKKNKNLSPDMKPLKLTEREINDLVAFMGALTQPLVIKPPKVP